MSNGHVRAIAEALSRFKIGGGLLGTFAFKDLLEELKSTKNSCLMYSYLCICCASARRI